ncbi:MAG: NAD-binding protein [Alphaproteobacteria bacterium]|nr:NAD-binding protein [Alphaproteobacteria bacterium]
MPCIGSELSQAFARFGSEVTIVQQASSILVREDEEITSLMMQKFKDDGVRILIEHTAKEVQVKG